MRALAVLLLFLAAVAPAAAQVPNYPQVGALGDGRALVAWSQYVGGGGFETFYRASGGDAVQAPEQASRGITSILTTPGRGGVMVLGETGTFPGDRYGPTYAPIRFWTADVAPSGAVGPMRLLDEDEDGGVHDPVGWAGPDGEVLLAWGHGRRGRWVRRSPNGTWGRVRSLGALFPAAIARDGAGRLVVTGRVRGSLSVRIAGRTLTLGEGRSISSGPTLALSRDGMLLGWLSGERGWYARLDRRGRLLRRGRLRRFAGQATEVGLDARGRGVLAIPGSEGTTVAWVDRRGRVVRRRVLEASGYALRLAVDAGGGVLLVRETSAPPALSVMRGSTSGRLSRAAPAVPVGYRGGAADIAPGDPGEWFLTWSQADDDGGAIWLQRWARGRADPAERVYATGA